MQLHIRCGFTLKRVRDMIRAYSQEPLQAFFQIQEKVRLATKGSKEKYCEKLSNKLSND